MFTFNQAVDYITEAVFTINSLPYHAIIDLYNRGKISLNAAQNLNKYFNCKIEITGGFVEIPKNLVNDMASWN